MILYKSLSFSVENVKSPSSKLQIDSFPFKDSCEITITIIDMLLNSLINVVSIYTDLISDLQITLMPRIKI